MSEESELNEGDENRELGRDLALLVSDKSAASRLPPSTLAALFDVTAGIMTQLIREQRDRMGDRVDDRQYTQERERVLLSLENFREMGITFQAPLTPVSVAELFSRTEKHGVPVRYLVMSPGRYADLQMWGVDNHTPMWHPHLRQGFVGVVYGVDVLTLPEIPLDIVYVVGGPDSSLEVFVARREDVPTVNPVPEVKEERKLVEDEFSSFFEDSTQEASLEEEDPPTTYTAKRSLVLRLLNEVQRRRKYSPVELRGIHSPERKAKVLREMYESLLQDVEALLENSEENV